MPRLSDTMEEGTIASWLKKPGEQVTRGEVIAQIETDKATMDLTAFEAGTLQEILEPEGSTVAIGKPVARIGSGEAPRKTSEVPAPGDDGASQQDTPRPSDVSRSSANQPEAQTPSGNAQPPSKAGEASQPDTPPVDKPSPTPPADEPGANGKVRASPMARHIAAEHGLNLSDISGSGPQGRVVRADVEAAVNAGPAPGGAPTEQSAASTEAEATEAEATVAEATEAEQSRAQATSPSEGDGDQRVQLSQMRRTIARRLAESKRTVPHFYLTTVVDATDLGALRKQINEQTADAGIKVSFNDLIVKGAALAIRNVPDVNVSFAEDALVRHTHVNVGIAVATERGLIVPVIRDADQKSVGQISREAHDLAERANAGKLQPNEYSGGTFSVSNLGMFGVEQFQAVINPPEAAILAVGAIIREPAEFQGEIALRDRLRLTLSVDHRALDGATGARYLQALKALLEKPMRLLV